MLDKLLLYSMRRKCMLTGGDVQSSLKLNFLQAKGWIIANSMKSLKGFMVTVMKLFTFQKEYWSATSVVYVCVCVFTHSCVCVWMWTCPCCTVREEIRWQPWVSVHVSRLLVKMGFVFWLYLPSYPAFRLLGILLPPSVVWHSSLRDSPRKTSKHLK